MPNPLDREALRERVQSVVDAEISAQRQVLAALGSDVEPLVETVADLIQGGKRLRAGFLYWGYRASGMPGTDAVVRLATATEFFQAAALLHDDVMDHSDIRRGRPSAHRAFADHHDAHDWEGSSADFGAAGAILAGNLCLGWSDTLVATCGLPHDAIARARTDYDAMRTQLMGGQFLDLLLSARGWAGETTAQRIDQARKVIRFKSAKYSIEQPLLIGMRAAGIPDDVYAGASAYGLALGEAFQLRDDILGVFGDSAQTGKPAGDDLREGKRTVLVAEALELGGEPVRRLMEESLGRSDLDDAGVARLREALQSTGAVDRVEGRIAELSQAAREQLSVIPGLDPLARDVLGDLIDLVTVRDV